MCIGSWQRKHQRFHYTVKLVPGKRLTSGPQEPAACRTFATGFQDRRAATLSASTCWPTLHPERGRWAFVKQESWEITRSNHALKIRYERATQCSRKNEPRRVASTVKPTYYILLKISLMLTQAQRFLSLALGEILWRCFTLVRFMSLWPWLCPWE